MSFPDYATSIGEISAALQGERSTRPDVMQLLYVASRYERKPDLLRWLEGGLMLVSDRYPRRASPTAKRSASTAWLADLQKFLPPAWMTIFLDIARDGDSGRPSIATATNETSRCRPAFAKAISARPRKAGWCSTASAPRTPSPRTCSARSSRLEPL